MGKEMEFNAYGMRMEASNQMVSGMTEKRMEFLGNGMTREPSYE